MEGDGTPARHSAQCPATMVTRGAVLAAWLAAVVWLLWGDLLSSLLLPASHTYLATPHPPSPHTPPPAPSIPAHTLNTYHEDGES